MWSWRRARSWSRWLGVGFIASGLSLVTRDADAFCRLTTCDPNAGDDCRTNDRGCIRDGVPLKWMTMPIVYRFHSGGSAKLNDSKMRAAVRRAFEQWSSVECRDGPTSLRFEEGDDITDDKPLGEKEASEKFGIYFRDDEWPHNNADESLALTNQVYGKVSGKIDYADIEVNTANNTFSLSGGDGIDLQAVVTHEVGHYIGLAHSTNSKSIMLARYCESGCGGSVDAARELTDDDRSAVCAIYEPETRSTTPLTTGGCTTSTSSDAPWAMLGGSLLFLGAALRRRRRAS